MLSDVLIPETAFWLRSSRFTWLVRAFLYLSACNGTNQYVFSLVSAFSTDLYYDIKQPVHGVPGIFLTVKLGYRCSWRLPHSTCVRPHSVCGPQDNPQSLNAQTKVKTDKEIHTRHKYSTTVLDPSIMREHTGNTTRSKFCMCSH